MLARERPSKPGCDRSLSPCRATAACSAVCRFAAVWRLPVGGGAKPVRRSRGRAQNCPGGGRHVDCAQPAELRRDVDDVVVRVRSRGPLSPRFGTLLPVVADSCGGRTRQRVMCCWVTDQSWYPSIAWLSCMR